MFVCFDQFSLSLLAFFSLFISVGDSYSDIFEFLPIINFHFTYVTDKTHC